MLFPAAPAITGVFGREVTLTTEPPKGEGLKLEWVPPYEETVRDYRMPAGAFFDLGAIHLLTTASIERLRELYPQGQFEARRFRRQRHFAAENARQP